jgi:LPS export ABC transporter protein LptC
MRQAAELAASVDVDVSVSGLTLSKGSEGRLDWSLAAKGAEYLREQGRVRVTEPEITYFAEGGNGTRREIRVSAPEGLVDQEQETAELWPEVDIVIGPDTVRAERLRYSGAEHSIVLTGGVRIARPGMALSAERVVIDLATSLVTAQGGVSGEIELGPQTTEEEPRATQTP